MAMAVMTLAQGMRVFGVVHHARLQIELRKLGGAPATRRKSRAAALSAARDLLDAAQGESGLMFRVVQPIGRPTVVRMELLFVLTSERRRLAELRRAFDSVPVKTDVNFGIYPADSLNPRG